MDQKDPDNELAENQDEKMLQPSTWTPGSETPITLEPELDEVEASPVELSDPPATTLPLQDEPRHGNVEATPMELSEPPPTTSPQSDQPDYDNIEIISAEVDSPPPPTKPTFTQPKLETEEPEDVEDNGYDAEEDDDGDKEPPNIDETGEMKPKFPLRMIILVVAAIMAVTCLVVAASTIKNALEEEPTAMPTVTAVVQASTATLSLEPITTSTAIPVTDIIEPTKEYQVFIPTVTAGPKFVDMTDDVPGRTWVNFLVDNGYHLDYRQEGELLFFDPYVEVARAEVAEPLVLYALDITPWDKVIGALNAKDLQNAIETRDCNLDAETILEGLKNGELPQYDSCPIFFDVPEDHPQREWILKLFFVGKVAGCAKPEPSYYCPDDPLQQVELAVMKVRILKLAGREYIPEPATGTIFVDVPVEGEGDQDGTWWPKWAENDAIQDFFPLLGEPPYEYGPHHHVRRIEFAYWLWFLEVRRVMEGYMMTDTIPWHTPTPTPMP